MARRKDDPRLQAAKGFPGRRRSQTERDLAKAKAAMSPEDELLASLDVDGLRPPANFARKGFEEELSIWRTLIPRLKQLARASAEFQAPLAAYCDSVARYNRAVRDLHRNGQTQVVKTVSGDTMLRINPSERIRATALSEILAISARFGFSPADSYALMLDQRRILDRGSFGQLPFEAAPAAEGAASLPSGRGMDEFDSPPPARVQ